MTIKSLAAAAALVSAIAAAAPSSALAMGWGIQHVAPSVIQAQYMRHHTYQPRFARPSMRMHHFAPRTHVAPNRNFEQRFHQQVTGPIVGRGVTNGLMSKGVPKPLAGWAGERVRRNADTMHRERTIVDRGIKLGTGVSVRDIQRHGIFGGPNSELRRLFGR